MTISVFSFITNNFSEKKLINEIKHRILKRHGANTFDVLYPNPY